MRKRYLAVMVLCALVGWSGVSLARLSAQPPPQGPSVEQPTLPITEVPGAVRTVTEGQPSQPAVSVTTIPGPVEPQHVQAQIIWALAASYVLRYLTKKGWLSFLNEESTARVKAGCALLMAVMTAAGIHFAVSGSILDQGGAAITISGVSWDALKDVGFQWVSQQAWYDGLVKVKTKETS